MKETKFNIGDKAYKPKGYKFPYTIVSVFETSTNKTRVVAEMDEYGLLHIFNETQLEHFNLNPLRDKLTKQWLIDTFHEITEDIGNGETMYNVRYSEDSDGNFMIIFDLDLGRGVVDLENSIKIFKNNEVTMWNFSEYLEGSGIEVEFEKQIKNYIYEN